MSPTSPTGAIPPSDDFSCSAMRVSPQQPDVAVGQGRHGISDAELIRHIADCRYQASLASARFRGSHSRKDASERDAWQLLMDAAIKARQALYLERKDAERDQELTFAGSWAASIGRLDVSAQAVRRRTGRQLG